jgi:RNA polymerase sigma-70 factor, ECF subfamily
MRVDCRSCGAMDEPPTHAEWQRWFEDHVPKFLLFARLEARSEADAQDLVQEAVVETWRRHGSGLPPPALVLATIRRRAVDLGRSEDRRTGRERAATRDLPEAWLDSSLEDRELKLQIAEAMSRLPAIYREVITLRVWGELTFAQIADVLDIPANTAASRYRYGLAELRKLAGGVLI